MKERFGEILQFIRKLYNKPEGIIPLHAPVFGGNEKKFLEACIDSTFVSSVGPFVTEFEQKMAAYTGAPYAVACVNGTAALFLALKLAGVKPGDEVITQPLTFVATSNAISYHNAHPVFLDVDRDTLGLSPEALLHFFKTHTRYDSSAHQHISTLTNRPITACVPVHTFGHPCRIADIAEICDRYGIPVIEDAAESLGSYYRGKHTGTFGTTGVLSFNGNKILTTGGGGMLLFHDEDLAKHAKHLTTQAKVPHPWAFVHDETGYNLRMPNLNAALGLAQLEQLDSFRTYKRNVAEQYRKFFSSIGIGFFNEPPESSSNYWLNTIFLADREERYEFLEFSNGQGVMTRPAWELMNRLAMYKEPIFKGLLHSEWLEERILNLPSSVI